MFTQKSHDPHVINVELHDNGNVGTIVLNIMPGSYRDVHVGAVDSATESNEELGLEEVDWDEGC